MRKLMFRAWDTKTKKMIATGFHVIGETTMFNMIEVHCQETRESGTTLERLNDIVVMQYTGFKDRLGKDIYEGDIVNLHEDTDPEPYTEICRVIFNPGMGAYDFEFPSHLHCLSMVDEGGCWCEEDYTIVGNIYENPELFK